MQKTCNSVHSHTLPDDFSWAKVDGTTWHWKKNGLNMVIRVKLGGHATPFTLAHEDIPGTTYSELDYFW